MYYNISMDIKEQLRLIPESSGSYQFFDKDNTIIYVGKAKNLNETLKLKLQLQNWLL